MELQLEKTVKDAEDEIQRGETEFFKILDDTFKQAVSDIRVLSGGIKTELVDPLKKQYGDTGGLPEKRFLDFIDAELRKFNTQIDVTKTWFISSFGSAGYGIQFFLNKYGKYFDIMPVSGMITPVSRGVSGLLHGAYQRQETTKKNGYLSGLGIVFLVPIAIAAAKALLLSKATDFIIERIMSVQQIQDLVVNLLRTIVELYAPI
jgi:hypothetical protein